jgi:hypothetical protein
MRVRAVLIAFHMFAVAAVAFPAPLRKMDEATWQKPSIRSELRNWTERIRGWGFEMDELRLRELVTQVSHGWQSGRNRLVAPLKSYLRALGTSQGWYMFTGPDRAPQRFVVSFTEGRGPVQRIFDFGRSLDRPELVPAGMLTEHRVRRIMFQSGWRQGQTFEEICSFFAREVRARHHKTNDVICQLIARPVLHPSRPMAAGERPTSPAPADERSPMKPGDQLIRTLVSRRDGTWTTELAETPERRKKKRKAKP